MAPESISFIISIGVLPLVALAIIRLFAIRMGRDPLMRRQKPGTPGYESYQRLLKPARFTTTLAAVLLVAVISVVVIVSDLRWFARMDTPGSHFMLLFGPIAAVVITAIGLVVAYRMFVRDVVNKHNKKASERHRDKSSWLV